jgi:hypothetical protein
MGIVDTSQKNIMQYLKAQLWLCGFLKYERGFHADHWRKDGLFEAEQG